MQEVFNLLHPFNLVLQDLTNLEKSSMILQVAKMQETK